MDDRLVLEAIRNTLPGSWTIDFSEYQEPSWTVYPTRSDGLKLAVRPDTGEGRWKIKLHLGSLSRFSSTSFRKLPSISITKAVGGDKIARAIQQRLLRNGEAIFQQALLAKNQHEADAAAKLQAAHQFAAFGFEVTETAYGGLYVQLHRDDENHSIYGNVDISKRSEALEVDVHYHGLSLDLALQIARLVTEN